MMKKSFKTNLGQWLKAFCIACGLFVLMHGIGYADLTAADLKGKIGKTPTPASSSPTTKKKKGMKEANVTYTMKVRILIM